MVKCDFCTIYERDMDILFLQSFVTDPDFARMVVDKTNLRGSDFSIVSAVLSHTDTDLGESDITIIIEVNGVKHALLIEDKVDAIAMPNQHGRYQKRGQKGIQIGEYDSFDIFIFCPEKYFSSNEEAKLYEHHIFYEECKAFFDGKTDLVSDMRSQQLDQAITRAKRPANVTLNEAANSFFIQYKKYQQEHYSHLDLRTKEKSNGWWVKYSTRLVHTCLLHKMQEGTVDLTFSNAAEKISTMQGFADWLNGHGFIGVTATVTGKAAALRIRVPKLDVLKPFSDTPENDIILCFEAISQLIGWANLTAEAHKIYEISAKKK